MPTIHQLPLERRTLHGHFSRDLPPVLTIESGDTVHCQTLDAGWGIEPYVGGPYAPRKEYEGRIEGLDDGHPMVGPIAIDNAKKGQTLEVRIKDLKTATWGYCLAGGWQSDINEQYNLIGKGIAHAWTLDPETKIGTNHLGHSVTLNPFLGLIGMPPDEAGIHSTTPPRIWGGNLDCKELVVGSRLFLPIPVDGAFVSVGDGHAAQGDGEISGTAIECGMEHVELSFHLHDDFPITTPVADTPKGWLTMGLHEDLNQATFITLEAMFSLIQRWHELDRPDAIALASVTVDCHITQIVNQVKGVHAILPHGAIK